MRRLFRRLPLLLAAFLALAVAGCGGDDDGKTNDPRRIQANPTDLAFAEEMLAHHAHGIAAAKVARTRGKNPVIRRSARDLIQLQEIEAQTLRSVKKVLTEGGVERGSLGVPQTTLDPDDLRRADDFDRAYADGMIAYHKLAMRMTAAERAKGIHEELRRMSGDIDDLARFQIRQLERQDRQ